MVAPGYTALGKLVGGNPYDTSWHRAGHDAVALDDVTRAAARVRAPRVVRFARAVVAAG